MAGLSGNIDHLNPIEVEIEVGLGFSLAKLCKTKAAENLRYMHWFSQKSKLTNSKTRKTRSDQSKKYHPVQFRTSRYKNSPLPYLTELLNNM